MSLAPTIVWLYIRLTVAIFGTLVSPLVIALSYADRDRNACLATKAERLMMTSAPWAEAVIWSVQIAGLAMAAYALIVVTQKPNPAQIHWQIEILAVFMAAALSVRSLVMLWRRRRAFHLLWRL